jgi:hypothetical protein
MRIEREKTETVIDDHRITIDTEIADKCDDPASWPPRLGSVW